MHKYLSLSGSGAERFKELLPALTKVAGMNVRTHEVLMVGADNIDVLQALQVLFGGSMADVEPAVMMLVGESPITYQPPHPPVKLAEPFEQLREKLIDATDLVIGATENLNFPPRRDQSKKGPLKPTREIRSWHVILGGQEVEVITTSEKNRRLAAGEFETGTQLKHPKAGLQRVTGEKGMPQGMEPVAE